MSSKTWIVYKTESMAAPGWESRRLEPSGSGTDILWENWDYSGRLPQAGERTRLYGNPTDLQNGITHGKLDDWVVARVEIFSSEALDERIVVCYCAYSPIEADWQPVNRGKPVHELLTAEQPA